MFNWDWLSLSSFSKSKLVKSMVYWLFITPIVAKALSSINQIDLSSVGFDGSINITLPFSWTLFFFSALFFSIGNFLYTLKCPELIRDYSDFNDYISKQNSTHYLIESFKRDLERWIGFSPDNTFNELVLRYSPIKNLTERNIQSEKWTKLADSLKEADNNPVADIYSGCKLVLKEASKPWRTASTIFYLIGLVLFSIVLVQNIVYVISTI